MREGFDQFCPDCVYSSYLNTLYGKCCCTKLNTVITRKKFNPTRKFPDRQPGCNYFRSKNY